MSLPGSTGTFLFVVLRMHPEAAFKITWNCIISTALLFPPHWDSTYIDGGQDRSWGGWAVGMEVWRPLSLIPVMPSVPWDQKGLCQLPKGPFLA